MLNTMLMPTIHISQDIITYCAGDIFTFLIILKIMAIGKTF